MNLPRFLFGLLLASTPVFLGCQESPKELASHSDSGLPTEVASFALDDGLPAVSIVSPEPYTYYKTSDTPGNAAYNPDHPLVDVTVQFSVAHWAYPAATKGVAFILDKWDQSHPELAIVQTSPVNPIVLADIPPGQHTIVACLVLKSDTGDPTPNENWYYLDADPNLVGVQRSCGSVVIKVAIVDCWPTIYNPATAKYICDPAHPGACCIDTNPCSVDNCQWVTSGGLNQYECRFGPVAGQCCQSDYECGDPQRCYLYDNPDTSLDNDLVNKCYECDYMSATADDACDDLDKCTVDSCGQSFFCEHAPIVGAQGEPCCMDTADCNDDDPCTIDQCENKVAGQGFCKFYSYLTLSDADITGYGYDPSSFEGCCSVGKELEYCTDHLIVIDNQLQLDACWNVACISNQCRYGKDPNPLCCNTGAECDDCADFDPGTGECVKANVCTIDLCVENECRFQWDPFHPSDEDCCQHTIDCDDDLPNTIDWCSNYLCYHETDPLYCDPGADPPAECPAPPNPCITYTCNDASNHCDGTGVPGCCLDNDDCDDSDYCSTDVCDPLLHTCSHEVIELIGGKKCCNISTDCYDGKVCTTEACVSHQCRYGAVAVNPTECASGKCCNSNADLNGNSSADDCEVANSCTPFTCANHCCVPKTNLPPGQCITALDCEDGDPYTWNVCTGCTCALNPPTVCDEAHPTCNDSNACTIDSCDFNEKRCKYVAKPNCCVQQADCVPATPDPCTNYQCIKSLNICQNSYVPDCCTSDDDTKCNDFNGCTDDFCVNGKCRHNAFDANCCISAADCNDSKECTRDECIDNQCQHSLLASTPSGALCCETDGACTDTMPCTQDTCINNKCENLPVQGCCYPDGQDHPMCEDGNPCTADWCVYGICRHLGPGEAPASAHIPDTCCIPGCIPGDEDCCEPDDNVCTLEECAPNGLCVSTAIEPCRLQLPYCQSFNQGTWPPEFLGWKREDTLGAPANFNWEDSGKGPLGLDFHMRFSGLKFPLDEFNAYLLSPAFESHDASGKLLTDVTVQWETFLDLNSPETTNLAVSILPNGAIANGTVRWSQSTTSDLEASVESVHHHATYLGDYFKVAFNVNALHEVAGANVYGGAAHINAWDLDSVCICAGQAPEWINLETTYGMFLQDSEHFPLRATDPDSSGTSNPLSFEALGAPDFVTIVNGGWDWQTSRWVADMVVSPVDEAALGQHTFTLRISDGCLFTDREVTVWVFLRGGYLVWSPEGVSPLHAQRIVDAIAGQPDQTTAKRQWQVLEDLSAYPDLSVADGIFGCLGIKGAAYEIVEERDPVEEALDGELKELRDRKEALVSELAIYLEGGGRLYLEGGETWYDDVPTALHDYMRVEATSGGVTRLDGPVAGEGFLRALTPYGYDQLPYNPTSPDNFWNNFLDRIKVKEHTRGRVFLQNTGTTEFPTTVGYCDHVDCPDGSDDYRTIASSIPFGGLLNGPSTRVDLMGRYLYFFEHGYPTCATAADCDDGQQCTTDNCAGSPKRCSNTEQLNCEYCLDDLDCDQSFPTLDYACHTSLTCKPLPGYIRHSSGGQDPFDEFIPGLGWQSPIATSVITLGGAGAEAWEARNVAQVAAKLRVTHDYIGEVEITLQHGSQTVTAKLADLTQFGGTYYFTTSEAWGRPAAAGSMDQFKNAAIEGAWTLTVRDTKPANTRDGKLIEWWLFVAPDDVDCSANPSLCEDGNACTVDQCLGGFCKNSLLLCQDIDPLTGLPNLCTSDACDPSAGCTFSQKICDDGNDCSIDLCKTDTGECYQDWPTECYNPCTRHADCGNLQYCNEGHCEIVPGLVYESPVTGSAAIIDNGAPQVYPLNIPDGTDKDSLDRAVEDRAIHKLRVKVRVTHEDVTDLEIKLVRGTTEYVLLPENAGSGGPHWVFASNDAASFDVPATNLDDAPGGQIGQAIAGDWYLSIQDRQLGNTGTLDGWVLFMVQRHCATNADCNDDSLCTADLCLANTSGDPKEQLNIPLVCSNSTDAVCDDGLWCNGVEFCHPDTGCVDGQPPTLDDNIPCTDDLCDEYNDEVYHLANVAYCNDDNPCTTDVCDADCSDGACGCRHLDNTDACDDGIYCTTNDQCGAGECKGVPTNAKPGCSCNVTADCQSIFNDNRCAGAYICNVGLHTCVIDPATEVDCSTIPGYVNDPCAKHLCDPQDGECKMAFIPDGVLCEDGDLCTQNDVCNGSGQCLGVQHICDDAYWCNGVEACDPLSGECVPESIPIIDDGVPCTIDVCDNDAEQIHHFPDDTSCDNGLFCDGVEICNPVLGCQDGPNPNCEDYNPCTVNKCDELVQACDFHDHVQHCSWPCDGDHTYDAGDDDCGYDDACVGGAGATAGSCQPICGASCYVARAIPPNDPELAQTIPDNDEVSCVERTLTLALPPNLRFVERVEARVQVSHTSIVDLRVSLTDPDGYTVKMWENAGGSRDDFANTFEQSWADTYRPMCAFRGDVPSGDWLLRVCDVLPQSQGTLDDWTLYVKGSETDTNLGDRCDNALAMNPEAGTVIGPNEWNQTLSGSTACAQEDHVASCGGGGKDRVYRFHVSDHKLLNATVNTGGRNWVVYVKGANPSATDCTDTTLGCGAAPSGGAASIVDLKLSPGDYYFFIDSNGDYGDYAVDVTFKTLLQNGGTCDHLNDCISPHCVDGTCCNVACDGLCEACDGLETANGASDRGTCTYIADGRDPEEECIGDDEICGWTCYYNPGTGAGGDCKKPGTDTPHVKWEGAAITFGGICQRCDGNGDWEYLPHGTDPFLQCPNRACDGARLFYEQRCSNDEVTFPDRIGTCDCFDEKYGVFGCEADVPQVADDWCPDGYVCDPTDGPDDDSRPDDCRTACTIQGHCQYDGPPDGWYCEERVSEPGFHECKERKDLGLTCHDPVPGVYEYGECLLNGADPFPCVDGVCCNSTCTALCMRCDGVDTLNASADMGTCTFAADGKDPDVECRTDDTTNCGIGWCDGGGTCDWWDPDTVCVGQVDNFSHDQSCGRDNNGDDIGPSPFCQADGTGCETAPDWVLFPADTCSGNGYCLDAGGIPQTWHNCPSGLMCNDEQTDCKTNCVTDLDCSRPFPTDCDGDGGVNYYCRDALCNPSVCKNWMDPTTNGSQATPSASFGNVHHSLGGTPQGAGACSGANCSMLPGAATKSDLGFYPQTRAIETPLQYRN